MNWRKREASPEPADAEPEGESVIIGVDLAVSGSERTVYHDGRGNEVESATAGDETNGHFINRIGLDARAWAREFVRLHDGDEDLMIAWFASAIELARDAGRPAEPTADDEARALAAWADYQSGNETSSAHAEFIRAVTKAIAAVRREERELFSCPEIPLQRAIDALGPHDPQAPINMTVTWVTGADTAKHMLDAIRAREGGWGDGRD